MHLCSQPDDSVCCRLKDSLWIVAACDDAVLRDLVQTVCGVCHRVVTTHHLGNLFWAVIESWRVLPLQRSSPGNHGIGDAICVGDDTVHSSSCSVARVSCSPGASKTA